MKKAGVSETDILFDFGIPVKAAIEDIRLQENYHRHEAIQFILVLEGAVCLRWGKEIRHLAKNEMALVDSDLLHGIFTEPHSNRGRILSLYINPVYYTRYFHNLNHTLFLTCGNPPLWPAYLRDLLREHILEIALTLFRKPQGNFQMIEYSARELIRTALNNCQLFSAGLKDNEPGEEDAWCQQERMRRIYGYIGEHLEDRITLDDVSRWEHLNPYYLSHLIKKMNGIAFQDLIMLFRVRKSEILLLETSERISLIAKSSGFSATSYYIKYFTKWHGISPEEFRERYREDKKQSRKDNLQHDDASSHRVISDYINEGRLRIKSLGKSPAALVAVDINAVARPFLNPLGTNGKIKNIDTELNENARMVIRNMRKDFRISTVEIDLSSYLTREICNSSRYMAIAGNVNWLIENGMDVCFVITKPEIKLLDNLESFLKFYVSRFNITFPEIKYVLCDNGHFQSGGFCMKLRERIKNITGRVPRIAEAPARQSGFVYHECVYDSFALTAFAMDELFHPGQWLKPMEFLLIDPIRSDGNLLMGGAGLLTWNGIKKPWWYAYMFVSKMHGVVIRQGSDYIITKSGNQLILLTYNMCGHKAKRLSEIKNQADLLNLLNNLNYAKEHIFRLTGIQGEYKMTTYNLDRDACLFSKWADLGFPQYLSAEEEAIVAMTSHPGVEIKKIMLSGTFETVIKNSSFGVTCIILEEIIR